MNPKSQIHKPALSPPPPTWWGWLFLGAGSCVHYRQTNHRIVLPDWIQLSTTTPVSLYTLSFYSTFQSVSQRWVRLWHS